MVTYVFKDVLTIKAADKADPQKIGEALAKISEAGAGELTPANVVEAARAPRHILHRHFEWDDAKAASSFRIEQARSIIQSIRVEDADADEGSTRAFVSVTAKGGTSYRTVSDVRNSADLQVLVLAQAERDLESFQRRYRELGEICSIVRTAQEAVKERRKTLGQKGEHRIGA